MLDPKAEVKFQPNELIVSKTNPKGIITYANSTFLQVSGYDASDVLGKPHNVIRHDFMPKTIFKFLWNAIQSGNEIFAYVVNRTKSGGHYWVLAHVTPSIDTNGTVLGFHSNRRVPERNILEKHIIPLYQKLNEIETTAATRPEGLKKAISYFEDEIIAPQAESYQHFILTLKP